MRGGDTRSWQHLGLQGLTAPPGGGQARCGAWGGPGQVNEGLAFSAGAALAPAACGWTPRASSARCLQVRWPGPLPGLLRTWSPAALSSASGRLAGPPESPRRRPRFCRRVGGRFTWCPGAGSHQVLSLCSDGGEPARPRVENCVPRPHAKPKGRSGNRRTSPGLTLPAVLRCACQSVPRDVTSARDPLSFPGWGSRACWPCQTRVCSGLCAGSQ